MRGWDVRSVNIASVVLSLISLLNGILIAPAIYISNHFLVFGAAHEHSSVKLTIAPHLLSGPFLARDIAWVILQLPARLILVSHAKYEDEYQLL